MIFDTKNFFFFFLFFSQQAILKLDKQKKIVPRKKYPAARKKMPVYQEKLASENISECE